MQATLSIYDNLVGAMREVNPRGKGQFNPDDELSDLLDSISVMETVGLMEDRLDIRIPDSDLKGVTTVRGLAELIERLYTVRQTPEKFRAAVRRLYDPDHPIHKALAEGDYAGLHRTLSESENCISLENILEMLDGRRGGIEDLKRRAERILERRQLLMAWRSKNWDLI